MSNLLQKYNIKLTDNTNVEWITKHSDENSILFYKFQDENQKNYEAFIQRITTSKYLYCLVNTRREIYLPNIIPVDSADWLPLQEEICNIIYPFKNLFKSIAVTGTNGKTTTVDLIRQLMIQQNKNIMTIGTLGVWFNENKIDDFSLTSPSYIDFRKTLYKNSQNIDILAVEVSSHALDQNRYFNFMFDVGIWTNFTQDHLDYHGTLDAYFCAKEKLFDIVKENVFVCKNEQSILSRLSNKKPVLIDLIEDLPIGFLTVDYNKKNLSLALATLRHLNFITKPIDYYNLKPAPGRFNVVKSPKGLIVIDFAHTPDALENICKAIHNSYRGLKLITVFGCGGDRDKLKRPLMGKVASENSDFVIITSDNPRLEKPLEIINHIVAGISHKNYLVYESREAAIEHGYQMMDHAILLIAGKGHEDYIEVQGEKIPYSDLKVVERIINAK